MCTFCCDVGNLGAAISRTRMYCDFLQLTLYEVVPLAGSKAQVCSRLITGITGSNLAEDMDDACCVGSGFCEELITRSEDSYCERVSM